MMNRAGTAPGVDVSGTVTQQAGAHSTRDDLPTEAATFLWHDLRQSVAVIMASASAAAEDSSPSPETRRWLRHISEEAQRISRMCEHVIHAERAGCNPASVDEVALGVIDSIRAVVATNIEYVPSEEDISVDGPAIAIERALANVVDNACRAAGPDGRVRIVTSRAAGDSVIITVDDDGPGFGAAAGGRAGLGLEATRHVLMPLGGSLRISPRGPLGGARVELHVPASSLQPTTDNAT
jgi:signal transduction histidine kinase